MHDDGCNFAVDDDDNDDAAARCIHRQRHCRRRRRSHRRGVSSPVKPRERPASSWWTPFQPRRGILQYDSVADSELSRPYSVKHPGLNKDLADIYWSLNLNNNNTVRR